MGNKLKYERFLWFHKRIKDEKYPNTRHLAEKYEISHRTAQRDIEFMIDRLNAPIEYNHGRKGYFYNDSSFELPSQWFSEDNIMALALAVRLASAIPDVKIKNKLCDFIEKISDLHGNDKKLCLENISEKISVKNIEYSRVDEEYFHEIVNALFQKRPVSIAYYSPHTNKKSVRTILPLHLIHYMGSWHIIAFCRTRKNLRDFALSRIESVAPAIEEISLPKGLPSIKEYTRKNFGIMQGGETKEVCLRFSPSVAKWMHEQVWHPLQKISFDNNGGLVMQFPVADFREIKRRILSHGAEVKVVSPKALAREIEEEITRMGKIY
jgi:predicted DNA-binding transcriptional regulator YafY